jgi:hypothetical protein
MPNGNSDELSRENANQRRRQHSRWCSCWANSQRSKLQADGLGARILMTVIQRVRHVDLMSVPARPNAQRGQQQNFDIEPE